MKKLVSSFKTVAQLSIMTLIAFPPSLALRADETANIVVFREITGEFNNVDHPDAGAAHSMLTRIAPAAYGDGVDLPRGVPVEDEGDGDIETNEQTLPSARLISNLVHDQGSNDIPSQRRLNQLTFQFGQFLSHDTGLSEPNGGIATGGVSGLSGNESFHVEVSGSDPDFAFAEIGLTRTVSVAATSAPTGIREQINTITAFIDGSNVYGSDGVRADALREFTGGRLRTQSGPDGALPPYNTSGLPNANALFIPESQMYLAGDVRANEQIGLTGMHTLWVREHNRLAAEIAACDFAGEDLSSSVVDEQIYQRARAVVGALLQKITYYEWLPAVIGPDRLAPYSGYDPIVDPQISNEFSAAAFRIGHTMLPPVYIPVDESGNKGSVSLLNAFFNPNYVTLHGIDDIIRGQAAYPQQEIDRFVVDGVRNFLFGPGFGGLDLASLNLQRGRDHGIPAFNSVRSSYGLDAMPGFLELTGDSHAAAALQSAYGVNGLNQLDLWSGGLSERHLAGTSMGETFSTIFVDQFTRLRDGDRFYFENEGVYPPEFIEKIHHTSLADVIRRNTSVYGDEVNDYAFFVPGFHPYQPDVRIGRDPDYSYHRGDDIYSAYGSGQRLSMRASRYSSASVYVSLQNDGSFVNHMSVGVNNLPTRKFKSRFYETGYKSRSNITGSLKLGLYEPVVDPGDVKEISGKVWLGPRAYHKRRTVGRLKFRAENYYDSIGTDLAIARLVFK